MSQNLYSVTTDRLRKDMGQIELGGYAFRGICRIVPELDENGNPIEYSPKNEYNNEDNIPLNDYGEGHSVDLEFQVALLNRAFMQFMSMETSNMSGNAIALVLGGMLAMEISLQETATFMVSQQTIA